MRICFIGDSFVNGTGDPEYLGWTGRICVQARSQGYEITSYNLGVRRDTSADIKARWQKEVTCRLPAIYDGRIIFSFGANDATKEQGKVRVSQELSLQNTRDILAKAQKDFPVLMISPAPIAEDQEQNQRIGELGMCFNLLCQELAIPYLDVFTPLSTSDIWLKEARENDGAHPLARGYQEYAQLVQNWQGWQDWLRMP